MSQTEWFNTSTDPEEMLRWMQVLGNIGRTKAGKRRLRLFLCACCRRLLPLLSDPRAEEVVVLAERFADGQAAAELAQGRTLIQGLRAATKSQANLRGAISALGALLKPNASIGDAIKASQQAADATGTARDAELAAHCDLLREVFADGFRPAEEDLPAEVVRLADVCYAAFPSVSDQFPALADALQKAGEKKAAAHCRQPTHVKGCYVLDWIHRKL